MSSLNQVQLIGNVGKDPTIKTFDRGDKVANFSVACTEKWKDKATGDKKEKTEWVNVVVWGDGMVGVIENYVKKGSKVFVQGKFTTRKYEKDGVTHYNSEVVVQGMGGKIVLLGEGGGGNSDAGNQSRHERPAESEGRTSYDLDDDIPF